LSLGSEKHYSNMDIKNQFDHIADNLDEDLNFEGGDHIKD